GIDEASLKQPLHTEMVLSEADFVNKDVFHSLKVETVTEAFFRDYKVVFDKVEAEVKSSIPDRMPDDKVAREQRRLFMQRLFNCLMFIYFLQKKGWLAFEGDKNYLRRLFTAEADSESFFSERLYWLFFHGLSFAGEAIESSKSCTRRAVAESKSFSPKSKLQPPSLRAAIRSNNRGR
ncbi:MAG: hypothetical protein ACRD9R_15325, partial [Pyrinomonadaceae bacterium]